MRDLPAFICGCLNAPVLAILAGTKHDLDVALPVKAQACG